MIATTLYGGLGNQMFIYAAVRALSLRSHTPMAFNLKQGFKDDLLFHRSLELHHFELELPESKIATFDIPLGKYVRYVSRLLGFNVLKPSMRFLQERNIGRDEILHASHAFIEGYFGQEEYFEDYSEVIRKDFTVKKQYITEAIRQELASIKAKGRPVVMVGVRRYQECKVPGSVPTGAMEDPSYFKSAMKYMAERLEHPVFWVFSQQQEWFKEHVDDGTYEVVYASAKTGDDASIEDFYLMLQCDHYIVSKSSYYWWAAWLPDSRWKTVVCPAAAGMKCKGWTCL